MKKTIEVPYAGDGFYPSPESDYSHEGTLYTIGILMHMEIKNGLIKSYMRAYRGGDTHYFEFTYQLSTSTPAQENVLPLRQRA